MMVRSALQPGPARDHYHLGLGVENAEPEGTDPTAEIDAAVVAHAAAGNPHPTYETSAEAQAKVDAAVTALKNGVGTGGDTLFELDARIAIVEALGSLATDAEVVAAVAALVNSATGAADTLGELEALNALRMVKSANLSDVANPATARSNLGLGTAAENDVGDFEAAGAVDAASSAFIKTLLDDADAAAARATLGVTEGPTIIRGVVAADGSVAAGTGFSSVKDSTGNYTVTFTSAFAATPVVITTPQTFRVVRVSASSPSAFSVNSSAPNTGSDGDGAFEFAAIAV